MGRHSEDEDEGESRPSGHADSCRATRASKRRKRGPQQHEVAAWCPPQDVFDVLCARFCPRNIVAMQLVRPCLAAPIDVAVAPGGQHQHCAPADLALPKRARRVQHPFRSTALPGGPRLPRRC
jgi:hypothetical protein